MGLSRVAGAGALALARFGGWAWRAVRGRWLYIPLLFFGRAGDLGAFPFLG